MSISDLSSVERRISLALVADALAAGFVISVYDGEEWVLKASKDKAAIEAVLGDTCETKLWFRDPAVLDDAGFPRSVGWVWLIHGNGPDVISDHSDNPVTGKLVARALQIGEDYSAIGS